MFYFTWHLLSSCLWPGGTLAAVLIVIQLIFILLLINWFGVEVFKEEKKAESKPFGIITAACSQREAFKGSRNCCWNVTCRLADPFSEPCRSKALAQSQEQEQQQERGRVGSGSISAQGWSGQRSLWGRDVGSLGQPQTAKDEFLNQFKQHRFSL